MVANRIHTDSTPAIYAALLDNILPDLTDRLYRTAASINRAETGGVPTILDIERVGGALAKTLGEFLLFGETQGFYQLQNPRYAADYFGIVPESEPAAVPNGKVIHAVEFSDEALEADLDAAIAAAIGVDSPATTVCAPEVKLLPQRRRCRKPGCKHTFKPQRADHWYHSNSCRSAHHTSMRRAAEKATRR